MIKVDEKLTQKVAELANLSLTADEVRTFTEQLDGILKYVELLDEANVSSASGEPVQPLTHPLDLSTPLRDDNALSSSSLTTEGYQVPPIL